MASNDILQFDDALAQIVTKHNRTAQGLGEYDSIVTGDGNTVSAINTIVARQDSNRQEYTTRLDSNMNEFRDADNTLQTNINNVIDSINNINTAINNRIDSSEQFLVNKIDSDNLFLSNKIDTVDSALQVSITNLATNISLDNSSRDSNLALSLSLIDGQIASLDSGLAEENLTPFVLSVSRGLIDSYVDSDYIQARQVDFFRDSAFIRERISHTNSGTGYGAISYSNTTGKITYTKVTDSDIRGRISHSNSGTGYGSISYASSTGKITYTKVTDADIRGRFTAGKLIDITNGKIDVDLSEATDLTDSIKGTDQFILLGDSNAHYRKAASEISLSAFNNDLPEVSSVSVRASDPSIGFYAGIQQTQDGELYLVMTTDGGLVVDSNNKLKVSSIDGATQIDKNTITADRLDTNFKLDASSIEFGTNQFDSSAISSGAITNSKLATDAVTSAKIKDDAVELGTKTTGNYVQQGSTSGNGISGQVNSEGGTFTVSSNATSSNTANTIVYRDASGDFSCNIMTGTASQANYADLAEIYSTAYEYTPGTILQISRQEESEMEMYNDGFVAGVISTNPGFLLNSGASGQPVALAGRVPVRVIGECKKGDMLYATAGGVAGKGFTDGERVGIALETNNDVNEKLVECLLRF